MLMKLAWYYYQSNRDPSVSLEDFFHEAVEVMYENYDYKIWKSTGGASFGTFLHITVTNHLVNFKKKRDALKRCNEVIEYEDISFREDDERVIFERLSNDIELLQLVKDLQKGGFSKYLSSKSELLTRLKTALTN